MQNAVKDPFLAILILSVFENHSVMIKSNGAIPIGFIKVKRVVRQKIKNCVSDCMKSIITFFQEL